MSIDIANINRIDCMENRLYLIVPSHSISLEKNLCYAVTRTIYTLKRVSLRGGELRFQSEGVNLVIYFCSVLEAK